MDPRTVSLLVFSCLSLRAFGQWASLQAYNNMGVIFKEQENLDKA